MKAFNELTRYELTDLVEDQVQSYIDLRCAEEGIPLLPPFPVAPPPSPEPTKHYYSYAGIGFEHYEDAQEVKQTVDNYETYTLSYIKGWGGPQKATPGLPYGAREITTSTAFSEDEAIRLGEVLTRQVEAMKVYEKAKANFDTINEQRQKVSNEINGTISGAILWVMEETRLRDYYNSYLKLAEGNPVVAFNFFSKSYSGYSGDHQELFEELRALGVEQQDREAEVAVEAIREH